MEKRTITTRKCIRSSYASRRWYRRDYHDKDNGATVHVNLNYQQVKLLATYKSGYVRRCDSSDRIWQLNHKYKRKVRWTMLDGMELVTREYNMWSRALIWSGLARLNFLHKYAKKNYLNK
jgi:hypothetical protein